MHIHTKLCIYYQVPTYPQDVLCAVPLGSSGFWLRNHKNIISPSSKPFSRKLMVTAFKRCIWVSFHSQNQQMLLLGKNGSNIWLSGSTHSADTDFWDLDEHSGTFSWGEMLKHTVSHNLKIELLNSSDEFKALLNFLLRVPRVQARGLEFHSQHHFSCTGEERKVWSG